MAVKFVMGMEMEKFVSALNTLVEENDLLTLRVKHLEELAEPYESHMCLRENGEDELHKKLQYKLEMGSE